MFNRLNPLLFLHSVYSAFILIFFAVLMFDACTSICIVCNKSYYSIIKFTRLQIQSPRMYATMETSRVAVVILNWNGLEDTVMFLGSLRKVTYPISLVIVVDNGSKGNDAQIIKEKYGDFVHVIESKENLGFAGGCNLGIKMAIKDN